MRKFLLPAIIGLLFISCSRDDSTTIEYQLATAVTAPLSDVRDLVSVEPPQQIVQSGKMYSYGNYIFVNDDNEGVHVIDNTNPEAPQKLKFLRIPGNSDISIKDNFLYADSYVDLVVFDITEITTITFVDRLENVFPTYNFEFPDNADSVDISEVDFESEIIVDWVITTESYTISGGDEAVALDAGDAGGTGTGGSLARFTIVDQYLYAVDFSNLYTFDISNLTNPVDLGYTGIGWNIETLFSDGDYLYIGSAAGMFIYGLQDPTSPNYLSEVRHMLGCDPVVVKGDYAFVTIRGGNQCGQPLSQLDVINIANRQQPYIETSIEMAEPYGLGIHENDLYVSDGPNGLIQFDISDPASIYQLTSFPDIVILDVIPLPDKLLLIGDNVLYQYAYGENDLIPISTFNLN